MKPETACVVLAALALVRAAAAAEAFERFAVTLEQCASVDADLVRKIAAVELGSPVHAVTPQDGRGWTLVGITCAGDEAQLRLQRAGSGAPLERALELAQHAGSERLVALAVAELIGASQAEAQAAPPPAETPTAPPSTTAETKAPASAPDVPRSVRAWLGAAVSLVRSPARSLAGLTAGVDWTTWDRVVLRLELVGVGGLTHTGLGEVRTLQLAAGPALLVEQRWRSLTVRGGGVVLAGATWLSLTPSDSSIHGRTLRAPHVGPAIALEGGYELGDWSLLLAAKLGWVGAPLRGTYHEREVASLRGAWTNIVVAAQHAW